VFRRVGRCASSKLLLIQNDQKRNSYHIRVISIIEHPFQHCQMWGTFMEFSMCMTCCDWFLTGSFGDGKVLDVLASHFPRQPTHLAPWSGVTPLHPCVHPAWTFHNMLFFNPSFNQSIFECDIEFLKASSQKISHKTSPFYPHSIPIVSIVSLQIWL